MIGTVRSGNLVARPFFLANVDLEHGKIGMADKAAEALKIAQECKKELAKVTKSIAASEKTGATYTDKAILDLDKKIGDWVKKMHDYEKGQTADLEKKIADLHSKVSDYSKKMADYEKNQTANIEKKIAAVEKSLLAKIGKK